jgi:hypothetical protein
MKKLTRYLQRRKLRKLLDKYKSDDEVISSHEIVKIINKKKNKTMKTNALLIGIIIVLAGGFLQMIKETPDERAGRINRLADQECNTGNLQYDNNCYAFYYPLIEDRD